MDRGEPTTPPSSEVGQIHVLETWLSSGTLGATNLSPFRRLDASTLFIWSDLSCGHRDPTPAGSRALWSPPDHLETPRTRTTSLLAICEGLALQAQSLGDVSEFLSGWKSSVSKAVNHLWKWTIQIQLDIPPMTNKMRKCLCVNQVEVS